MSCWGPLAFVARRYGQRPCVHAPLRPSIVSADLEVVLPTASIYEANHSPSRISRWGGAATMDAISAKIPEAVPAALSAAARSL